jgi:hypothetical protein
LVQSESSDVRLEFCMINLLYICPAGIPFRDENFISKESA